MAKKRLKIRLYSPHDLDLIALMLNYEIDLRVALYCAATAFSKHEFYAIDLPRKRENALKTKRVYHVDLLLDTEKDEKLLDILEQIMPGYRNNFMKNILRLYLCYPITDSFLIDKEQFPAFQKLFEIFTKERKVIEAGRNSNKQVKRKSDENNKKTQHGKEKVPDKVVITEQDNSKPVEDSEQENQEQDNSNLINDDQKPTQENEPDLNEEDLTDIFSALIG